jgi:CheY-like chemotaxis protein
MPLTCERWLRAPAYFLDGRAGAITSLYYGRSPRIAPESGWRAFEASQQAHAPVTDPPSRFVVAVVDDDHSILRSLESLLESADYAVQLFTSATSLLASGDLPRIDCLISDIDMPGVDGFELLRLVHAALPGLPTILITGYPDRLHRLPSLDGSKPRCFTKPFQGPELLAAIFDALRSSRK